jgi:hypothetical protein
MLCRFEFPSGIRLPQNFTPSPSSSSISLRYPSSLRCPSGIHSALSWGAHPSAGAPECISIFSPEESFGGRGAVIPRQVFLGENL